MSAKRGLLETAAMIFVCAFLGFVAYIFSQSLFLLFFVPIIVYVVWDDRQKVAEIQRRLSQPDAQIRRRESATESTDA